MGAGPVCSVRDRWVAAHINILVSELLYILLVGSKCFDVLSVVLTHIEIMFVDASAAASMSAFVRGWSRELSSAMARLLQESRTTARHDWVRVNPFKELMALKTIYAIRLHIVRET